MGKAMLKYGCTRSQLMKAAWRYFRTAQSKCWAMTFSRALEYAWNDARYGVFQRWPDKLLPKPATSMTEIETLKLSILTLDCKDRWLPRDYDRMQGLQDRLSCLQNTGNEQRLAA